MFTLVIQHLYALWNGHPNMSGNHMSPFKINTVLLTTFPMLHIISSWCIYFITGSLYFFHLLHPFPLWQPPDYFLYLWVCFWLFCLFVFWIPHSSEIMWPLSFSDLFHLAWWPQGPLMFSQWQDFTLLFGWYSTFKSYVLPPFYSPSRMGMASFCLHFLNCKGFPEW